jgi:hypothetical protein
VPRSRASRAFLTHGAALAALLAALAGVSTALRAQEVYKSVDADGHVVYSDRGATKTAPKTSVHVEQPDPVEAARLAKEQQLLQAEDAERTRQQAADDKARSASEKKKDEACKNARSQYNRMMDARRLTTTDAAGNRVYYSDDQADALREQAHKAMVAACGS